MVSTGIGLNLVTLIGRAGRDPELKYFESGTILCTIPLAVNRIRKAGEESPPDWFDLELWGRTAEICGEYIRKGSQFGITGQLSFSRWVDKTTGERRERALVKVENLELLARSTERQ
jgi:single-strand DNA-binding protein